MHAFMIHTSDDCRKKASQTVRRTGQTGAGQTRADKQKDKQADESQTAKQTVRASISEYVCHKQYLSYIGDI